MPGTEAETRRREFVKLNPHVLVSKPPTGVVADKSHPNVVVILAWMDAKLPHVLKYSNSYDALYPNTTQIIVMQTIALFVNSTSVQQAEVLPVLYALKDCGYDYWDVHAPNPGVIVHAFSNGGCLRLTRLSELVSSFLSKGSPTPSTDRNGHALPPTAFILDSCPGTVSFSAAYGATKAGVKHPLMLALFPPFFVLFWILHIIADTIFWRKDPISTMRARMLNPNVLPWMSACTPRLYCYSTADPFVMPKDVEAHAQAARERGFLVRMEEFGGTPHVAHARAHPERYWGAVHGTWELARSQAGL